MIVEFINKNLYSLDGIKIDKRDDSGKEGDIVLKKGKDSHVLLIVESGDNSGLMVKQRSYENLANSQYSDSEYIIIDMDKYCERYKRN